ncbi:chemotaxis protein CheY [Candidatus Magnetomorum sp. HK-1]|nr:chemotaxis protein CheY [Candidatus Magnetomorum sp. HK-1]
MNNKNNKIAKIFKSKLDCESNKSPAYPQNPILLIDDEPAIANLFQMKLNKFGVTNIETCNDARSVIKLLNKKEYEIIFLDLQMPYLTGEDLLPQIIHDFPGLPVIILTYSDDLDTVVRCMKSGVFDYLSKTVDDARLFTSVNHAIEFRDMNREIQSLKSHVLKKELNNPEAFSNIITQNDGIFSIFQYVESIASNMYPVFITGETGVGKGLLAESIHQVSQRSGNFMHVNVSGIDDQMFADTLFGHIKGAYTGANTERQGLCERASGGTLFLDEIGDLSMSSQIKLLNLLQEKKYYPVGSDKSKQCHARILTATNCNVEKLIDRGTFRKDLYFRLHTHRIHLPPLRERMDDIVVLLDHFLKIASREMKKKKPGIYKELIQLLSSYSFPGNIRELKAMTFDALSRHKTHILSLETFKAHMNRQNHTKQAQNEKINTLQTVFKSLSELPTIKQASEQLIHEAIKRSKGNFSIAAPILGITRQALSKRVKRSPNKLDKN